MVLNKQRLVSSDRFYKALLLWDERGFFKTAGLFAEVSSPSNNRAGEGPTRLYAYRSTTLGWLWPIYGIERIIKVFRGRFAQLVFIAYCQGLIMIGSFFLALLALHIGLRRGLSQLHAGTLALGAGLMLQNFRHYLYASDPTLTAIASVFLIIVMYLRERLFELDGLARRRTLRWIGFFMFWVAFSDVPMIAGFFVAAVALLSLFEVGPSSTFKEWATYYVMPLLLAFILTNVQLAVAAAFLDLPNHSTPVLYRMGMKGLGGIKIGGHHMILTYWRHEWGWFRLAFLASAGLGLAIYMFRDRSQRGNAIDLGHILTPIVMYVLFAATFSELTIIHPQMYDLPLVIAAVLIVVVYLPIMLARYYPHVGTLVLGSFLFAFFYAWVSLVDWSIALFG